MAAKHHGISSHREYLQVSRVPTVVESTPICLEYHQFSRALPVVQSNAWLSRVPPVVQSTSICREYLQLSKVPPGVESISSCPKYLQLSRTPSVVQSTSSCREHHHTASVGSISVSQEHEQLSEVPSVVEGTSNSRKYLRMPGAIIRSTSSCLSRGPPSVGSISVSQEHEQLSKVPPVIESTSSCPKYLQLSRVIFVRQEAPFIKVAIINLVRPSFVPGDSFDDVFVWHFKHFAISVVNLMRFDSGARQSSSSGCSPFSTYETYAVNQG